MISARRCYNPTNLRSNPTQILPMSVRGFVIAVSSFLFFHVGRWIHITCNTELNFMRGLFSLTFIPCSQTSYGEARITMERH